MRCYKIWIFVGTSEGQDSMRFMRTRERGPHMVHKGTSGHHIDILVIRQKEWRGLLCIYQAASPTTLPGILSGRSWQMLVQEANLTSERGYGKGSNNDQKHQGTCSLMHIVLACLTAT